TLLLCGWATIGMGGCLVIVLYGWQVAHSVDAGTSALPSTALSRFCSLERQQGEKAARRHGRTAASRAKSVQAASSRRARFQLDALHRTFAHPWRYRKVAKFRVLSASP